MKTLSAALLAELGLSVTRPGYLVFIDFPSQVRLSTFGDVEWNGYTWLGADVVVRNLAASVDGAQSATIELGNADLAWSALILAYGVARRAVRIWAAYAGALATADVVQVFDGVGAKPTISPGKAVITTATPGEARSSPRKFISAATGFQHLQPAGTRIPFNGETFVLDR